MDKYPISSIWYLKKGVFGLSANQERVYIPSNTQVMIMKDLGKKERDRHVLIQTLKEDGATVSVKILRKRSR